MTAIQSVGPPPERHADRVVAEMMQELARNQSRLWDAVPEIVASSSDGSPRAQRKMEERIRRAGALATYLSPGKRGRLLARGLRLLWLGPQTRDANSSGRSRPTTAMDRVQLDRHHERRRRQRRGEAQDVADIVRDSPLDESSRTTHRRTHGAPSHRRGRGDLDRRLRLHAGEGETCGVARRSASRLASSNHRWKRCHRGVEASRGAQGADRRHCFEPEGVEVMNLNDVMRMSSEQLRRELARLRRAGEDQHLGDIALIVDELHRRDLHGADHDIDFQ